MPVEQDEGPFEGQLGHALRDAAGGFEADRGALVAGGRSRGRRLRLRRRAAVMGGAAGITLVGVGGALLVPWDGGTPDDTGTLPSSVAARPSRTATDDAPTTGAELLGALEELLPKGEIEERNARGTDEGPLPPYAQVVLDDGKGPAAIGLSLDRVEPGSAQARETVDCPDKTLTPYDRCETSRLSDGSVLRIFQGYEYPDRRVDTKWWAADLITPSGQHVNVSEWNSAAEKDAPISRAEPPLSPAQLKTVVTAEVWRRAVDALPEDPKKPRPSATPETVEEPGVEAVLGVLVPLLPKSAEVVERGTDFTYLVLDDGKGRSYVQINVQHGMGDIAGDFAGGDTLPDGTLVATRKTGGDKGVPGTAMWTADTLRTDGFRVVVSAFNSGNQHDAPTREDPALTLEQLREIALSPEWEQFR